MKLRVQLAVPVPEVSLYSLLVIRPSVENRQALLLLVLGLGTAMAVPLLSCTKRYCSKCRVLCVFVCVPASTDTLYMHESLFFHRSSSVLCVREARPGTEPSPPPWPRVFKSYRVNPATPRSGWPTAPIGVGLPVRSGPRTAPHAPDISIDPRLYGASSALILRPRLFLLVARPPTPPSVGTPPPAGRKRWTSRP